MAVLDTVILVIVAGCNLTIGYFLGCWRKRNMSERAIETLREVAQEARRVYQFYGGVPETREALNIPPHEEFYGERLLKILESPAKDSQ